MKKIYIAGPMRGYADWNFPAFDYAAEQLKEEDWHVLSPTDIDRLYEGWGDVPPEGLDPGEEDFKRFIRRDLDILLEFSPENGDGVYMLKGWAYSKGAILEKALAEFLGLVVLYEPR